MDIREYLRPSLHATSAPLASSAEPTPTFTNSSRVYRTADGIHETRPSPPQQTPGTPLGLLLPPSTPDALPSSHSVQISAVDGATNLYPATTAPTIPEQGPCLTSGILTVDDASFTTEVLVHSGPTAAIRCKLVALLDTDSPQSFITAAAVLQLKASRSATDECERQNSLVHGEVSEPRLPSPPPFPSA